VIALGLGLIPSSGAQADWESDYQQPNTYWGILGSVFIPNYGSQIGEEGSDPYTGVTDSEIGGGLRGFFGQRVHPYAAFEVTFDWLTGIEFDSDQGKQDISFLKCAIQLKGYPLAKPLDTVLEGRLQPYIVVSPGVGAALDSTLKTAIHFNIGLGGGVAYWVHDSWTLHTEGQYAWSFGTIDGLNFATISFGAAYHF
jgi:opacity protein-like surface antigen